MRFHVGDRVRLVQDIPQSSLYGEGTITECPGWLRRPIYTIAWDSGDGCPQWHKVFLVRLDESAQIP